MKAWGSIGLVFLAFLWVADRWNGQKKVKKMFKNVFPKDDKTRSN